jgi:hypothetical protein
LAVCGAADVLVAADLALGAFGNVVGSMSIPSQRAFVTKFSKLTGLARLEKKGKRNDCLVRTGLRRKKGM